MKQKKTTLIAFVISINIGLICLITSNNIKYSTLAHFYKNKSADKSITFFISPDCDECKKEMNFVAHNTSFFNNYELTFISMEPLDTIKCFLKKFGINGYNVKSDPNGVLYTKFNVTSQPTCFIFNKNRKLTQKITGNIRNFKNLLEDE